MTGPGDDAFQRLTDPHRRELLLHCYRMLGSLEDAEDMLQETMLRAWRGLDWFQGRTSLRRWLYKIATNLCLDAIESRRRRGLPNGTRLPAEPGTPMPGPSGELAWVEPVPDALIEIRPWANPEAQYNARESVSLAFLATLQALPGRQRAVLLLRDALDLSAGEVAEFLGTSVPAVNSALQRARAGMRAYRPGSPPANDARMDDDRVAALLSRYVDAWQAADAQGLVALLREDAAFTMPPLPLWYRGRESVRWFLETQLFAGEAGGRFRLLATRANGCPAFAVYQRDEGGDSRHKLGALHVLTIEDGMVADVHDYLDLDGQGFRGFELPSSL